MEALLLTALLLYTFGGVSFGALLVLALRAKDARKCRGRESIDVFLLLFTTGWFVLNLGITLMELFDTRHQLPVLAFGLMMAMALFFPPLIMHSQLLESAERAQSLGRSWMLAVKAGYALATVFAVGTLIVTFLFPERIGTYFLVPLSGLFFLFAGLGVFASALARRTARSHETTMERRYRRWSLLLYVLTSLVFLVILFGVFAPFQKLAAYVGVFSRSLPIYFLFVSTYYRSRFSFFDVFVKRGLYFFLILTSLTIYFAAFAPLLEEPRLEWIRPWIYAVTILPIVVGIPWLSRRLGEWLDRVWLGRQFSTLEAVTHFFPAIQGVTSEEDLIERAEERLATIMQGDIRILLEGEDAEGSYPLEIGIPTHSAAIGVIKAGKRKNETPYFDEDLRLMSFLGNVFCFMLETVRLQRKKQEQERREQNLILDASRSELKALRAQINPHFLFNALNAIAGLIPRDPARAEETVERLAEVFRYTLTRSEKEWVALDEELEFIQAYLDIERARFGNRLQVRLQVENGVGSAWIPAMIVQTLVENAIKHGIAAVKGIGFVEISARCRAERLEITVTDNGCGFPVNPPREERTGAGSGYGLRNVRERLSGYFGDDAQLRIERDEQEGLTRVSVSFPLSHGAALRSEQGA
jgi:signal transduction histidine kinase